MIATKHRHHDGQEHAHELTSTTGQHYHVPPWLGPPYAYNFPATNDREQARLGGLMMYKAMTAEDFSIELLYG